MRWILFFLILATNTQAQTFEHEKAYLNNLHKNKRITSDEFREKANKFFNLIQEMGGYPDLPYNDKKGKMEFNFIQEHPSSKNIIFNRVLEWAALTFGRIDAVLHYKDFDSGKIILKGRFNVVFIEDYRRLFGGTAETLEERNCEQTYIFTIKDGKLKIEIIQLVYTYEYYNSINNGSYTVPIDRVYPITRGDAKDWKGDLNMLKETEKNITFLIQSLEKYISDYDKDYRF